MFWLGFFFSSWKQDIHHRTTSFQWGKTVPYPKVIPVTCAQASPWRVSPSLRLVLQQGISESSQPALTPLKSPHTVRVHTVPHWRHHLLKALWGRGRLVMPASWQPSSPWAWRANPTETQPSFPLSRASRGRHDGVLPPPHGRNLLQRSVGALLQKALEIYFIFINSWTPWWCFITHWCQSLGTGNRLPCGCLCLVPPSSGWFNGTRGRGQMLHKPFLMMILFLEGRAW